MSERMVPVFQAQGEVEAQQVRAFLQAHGIPATMHGEALRKTHGLVLDGLGSVVILVQQRDAHQAGALLDRARRGELRLDEDHEPQVAGPDDPVVEDASALPETGGLPTGPSDDAVSRSEPRG